MGGVSPGFGAPGTAPGFAFIISIVPLNLGDAVPLMLNPHFWQVVASSALGAPQLGQNTR